MQLILFAGFSFRKMSKNMEKRLWSNWGNTARAATTRLGSKGLNATLVIGHCPCQEVASPSTCPYKVDSAWQEVKGAMLVALGK